MIKINKYNIKLSSGEIISLYFNTIDETLDYTHRIFDNTITEKDITIDTELDYMQYVNEIIDNSEGEIYIRNKKHHLYKSDRGLIPVNLWHENDFYFDGLQYIEGRYDTITKTIKPFEGEFTYPFGWTWGNPKEFIEIFKSKEEIHLPMELITKNQLTKEFKGKLINRKDKYIYKDKYGYYYLFDRYDINNKEYKQFKGNKDAVLVKYSFNDWKRECKWFNNIQEFKELWNKEYESKPIACRGEGYYEILKQGYNKLPPNERKCYLRLPYFNIHMYDHTNNTKEFKIHLVNMYLIKEMNNYRYLSADRDFNYCQDDFYEIVKTIWNIENEVKNND